MASESFTNSDGTGLSTHNAKWVNTVGIGDSMVVQSNAAQLGSAYSASVFRYEDSQPQNQSSQIFFKGGDWTDGIREVFCNGNDANDSYKVRVSSTWWSLYKDGSLYNGGTGTFQVSHGLSGVSSSGLTVKVAQESGGVVRVSLALGNASPTSVYSNTDSSPKTGGYPGFRIDKGANTRDQYTADDWTDGVGGGGGSSAPTLTDVDTDEILSANQTNIVALGNNLSAATIYLIQASASIAQAVVTTSTSGVIFDLTGFSTGGLARYGTSTAILVHTSAGSATLALVSASGMLAPLSPPAGRSWVTLGVLETSAPYRLEGSAVDLSAGDQIEYYHSASTIYVSTNGVVEGTSAGITYIYARVQDGTGWSDFATVSIVAPSVTAAILTAESTPLLLVGGSAEFIVTNSSILQLGKLVVGPFGRRGRRRRVYVARTLTSA